MSVEKALGLAELGMWVFPVALITDPTSGKVVKAPLKDEGYENGLKDATNDTKVIKARWKRHPDALVGVHTGRSNVNVSDLDVKRDDEGNILYDGFDTLDEAFLPLPDTFAYTTVGGEGAHYIYEAPEGVVLNGQTNYRRMKGVDRRGGESYVVWNGPVPASRAEFAPSPDWLNDPITARSVEHFEGTVKDWYESLEPGAPNLLVRNAIERLEDRYTANGNDMGHSEMVEAQHNAIRLGAEGNPGVDELLATIEALWLDRDPALHGTPSSEWAYKFQEALTSGIEKHGAAINLRSQIPPYTLALVPSDVPDSAISRTPATKAGFRDLLALLTARIQDDFVVTSILWSAPATKELAREWGLEFVYKRVTDARTRPEPIRENPTLKVVETPDEVVPESETPTSGASFLTPAEREIANCNWTFIDEYVAASADKGYHNPHYDIPAAWTVLSMAFGRKAYIPKGKPLEMNLWFVILGESGTGKTASISMTKQVLDVLLRDGETFYNLGANSTLAGLLPAFIDRDGKPSMILHDEAGDFFDNLKVKDYMRELEDNYSKWYDGEVDPSNKVSLKEYKGKGAHTSFNVYMLGTPNRLTERIDTAMFASGFAARVNWGWAPPPLDDDSKYMASLVETDDKGRNPHVLSLAADLAHASARFGGENRVRVGASQEAIDRLVAAHKAFDKAAKKHDRYDVVEPAVTRLGRETIWKCSALLALYRGETEISLLDVLTTLTYAESWFENLLRVAEATSEGEFSRDLNEIEAFIKSQGGGVTQARLNHRFNTMIRHSPRELSDRIDFLVVSGRINRKDTGDNKIRYEINGGE